MNFDKMKTKIWVNITFNSYDQLEGKDEFLATLKQDGVVVQERKEWYPACCTGQEIGVVYILLNSPFLKFLIGAAAGGMVWDMAKEYISKLFDSLRQLKDQNQDFSVSCLRFEFDDITIKIRSLHDVDYAYLQDTFFNMGEHIEYLGNQGVTDIREISLPYVKKDENFEENMEKYTASWEFTKDIDYYWKIEYANGCMTCYYNPKEWAIIEL